MSHMDPHGEKERTPMPDRDPQLEQHILDALVNILSDRARLSDALRRLQPLPHPVPVAPGTNVQVNVVPPPPCPCTNDGLRFPEEAEKILQEVEKRTGQDRRQIISDLMVQALIPHVEAYAVAKGVDVERA